MGSIMCFVLYLELRKKPEPPDDNGPRWYEQFDWTPDPPGGEGIPISYMEKSLTIATNFSDKATSKELIGSGSL